MSFYLKVDNKKVFMTQLQSENINSDNLDKIAHISSDIGELKVYSNALSINHKHLNYRFATIIKPQRNTVLTEFSTTQNGEFVTNFGDIKVPNGVVLQLFYHNSWYGVILGDIPKYETKKRVENSKEENYFLAIKQSIHIYHDTTKPFFLKQAKMQIKNFKKEYPNSNYLNAITKLEEGL